MAGTDELTACDTSKEVRLLPGAEGRISWRFLQASMGLLTPSAAFLACTCLKERQ
jgi:hypothetical protein